MTTLGQQLMDCMSYQEHKTFTCEIQPHHHHELHHCD